MAYRTIIVEGKMYEYSIGRSHVKFRGGQAVPYLNTIDADDHVGSDYIFLDTSVRVTPKHIRDYILKHAPLAQSGRATTL